MSGSGSAPSQWPLSGEAIDDLYDRGVIAMNSSSAVVPPLVTPRRQLQVRPRGDGTYDAPVGATPHGRRSPLIIDHRGAAARLAAEFGLDIPTVSRRSHK